jgi:hypothetical protein
MARVGLALQAAVQVQAVLGGKMEMADRLGHPFRVAVVDSMAAAAVPGEMALRGVMEELAQSGSSGPEQLVHSHQLIQGMCNA